MTQPNFTCEPWSTYHAARKHHLTSHKLADYRHCPRRYKLKQSGLIPNYDSEAYFIGRAAHCLILEGRAAFQQQYVVGGPPNPNTGKPYGVETKAYRQWAAKQTRGCLSDDQYGLLCSMLVAVQSHREASRLLSEGQPEGVLRGAAGGLITVSAQIRVDWWNPLLDVGLVDLKTCDDLDNFAADAYRFGYFHQLAFYRHLIEKQCGRRPNVWIIAAEKRIDFARCGVWRLPAEKLDQAERENNAAIAALKDSQERDYWPTGYESIREL